MARLDQSMKHGQPPEVALANFRTAIDEAQAKHAKWIQKVDWSPDSRVATLSGKGYVIDLTLDDEHVHARGTVPLWFKMVEPMIMKFVASTLDKQAATQAQGDGPSIKA